MAHFARLDSDNKVVEVHVVDDNWVLDGDGKESEAVGVEYLRKVYNNTDVYVQCSYTRSIRSIYPSVGDSYNATKDRFEAPKPSQYPSFVQNSSTGIWEPPVAKPAVTDKKEYWGWDEENKKWVDWNDDSTPE